MTDSARSLSQWLTYISTQHQSEIALGLERSAEVAKRMQLLPLAPRQLIVAGTNGKGSTVRFAEALLIAQGHRVGSTLSPHLHRYNERVRLNGEEASDQQLVDAFVAVEEARGDIPLTYYEYSVLGAFWLFKESQLDVCVLEVGLGGRLDITNIVDAEVAAVTSIGLDHQSFLGDTLELIGAEKAAVCRNANPLLLGAGMPQSVFEVAARVGAQVQTFGQDFWYQRTDAGMALRMKGGAETVESLKLPTVALRNAALAAACVAELSAIPTPAEVEQAIAQCRHPGRFEVLTYRNRQLVVDVAHNPASAEFLCRQLLERWPTRRLVACCGMLADKDVEGIVQALASVIGRWVFVSTGTSRGLSAEAALQRAKPVLEAAGASICGVEQDAAAGLDKAHADAAEADIIVAFGSFLQVEHVRELVLLPNAL